MVATPFDVLKDERAGAGQPESEALANTLDAAAYITVPIFRHQEINGRLYLSMKRRRTFDSSDVEFLLQVVEHVSPIIENIRLVDRLASDAAEQERQRIARDIHDSVIQPYIGFQMGLNGMRRKLSTGQVDLSTEIERLLEMTTVGIADLRRYVGGLKDAGARELSLLPMVRRFVRKFDEATGIEVRVEAPHEISMNDRLAAEVFQMVAEGLSNIRRHTEAARALIGIECDERKFILRIENDRPPHVALPPFTPRSLGERAASLNGCLLVENPDAGGTIVRIEIPL